MLLPSLEDARVMGGEGGAGGGFVGLAPTLVARKDGSLGRLLLLLPFV